MEKQFCLWIKIGERAYPVTRYRQTEPHITPSPTIINLDWLSRGEKSSDMILKPENVDYSGTAFSVIFLDALRVPESQFTRLHVLNISWYFMAFLFQETRPRWIDGVDISSTNDSAFEGFLAACGRIRVLIWLIDSYSHYLIKFNFVELSGRDEYAFRRVLNRGLGWF